MIANLALMATFLAGVALVPWHPSLVQETMECHIFDNFSRTPRTRYEVNNGEATAAEYQAAVTADNQSRARCDEFSNSEAVLLVNCRNSGVARISFAGGASLGWRINVPPNCACCHLLTDQISWTNRLEWNFAFDAADEEASGRTYYGEIGNEDYVALGMNMDGCPQDCPNPADPFELRRTMYYRLKVTFTRTAAGVAKAQLTGQYRYWHRENGVETNEGPYSLNELLEGEEALDSGRSLNVLSQRVRVYKGTTRMFWVPRPSVDGESDSNTRVQGEVFADAYFLSSRDDVEGMNEFPVDFVQWETQ